MKKGLLSIFTLLYLMVSSGIAMQIHYCMGERAGVEFFAEPNKKCGKCGMEDKNSGCCNDEHKFYKLSDEHKNISNDYSFQVTQAILPVSETSVLEAIPVIVRTLTTDTSPPFLSGIPLYLQYRVFRI